VFAMVRITQADGRPNAAQSVALVQRWLDPRLGGVWDGRARERYTVDGVGVLGCAGFRRVRPRARSIQPGAGSDASGSSTQKVAPLRGSEETPTRPRRDSTILFTVASPRPIPGWRAPSPRT